MVQYSSIMKEGIIGKQELGKGINIKSITFDIRDLFSLPDKKKFQINGLNGSIINVEIDKNHLSLSEENSTYYFIISFNEGSKMAHFIIGNDFRGQQSKNIFPAKLMEFFLNQWSNHINIVFAEWRQDEGTNITQYDNARENGLSEKNAALSTWTGIVMSKLGYTRKIIVNEFNSGDVFAYFHK